MPTLYAEHLAKSYSGRQVVKDVSFNVKAGEIVNFFLYGCWACTS